LDFGHKIDSDADSEKLSRFRQAQTAGHDLMQVVRLRATTLSDAFFQNHAIGVSALWDSKQGAEGVEKYESDGHLDLPLTTADSSPLHLVWQDTVDMKGRHSKRPAVCGWSALK
jgi:hypothetical protein